MLLPTFEVEPWEADGVTVLLNVGITSVLITVHKNIAAA